jgi:ABC-type multidrug transport system fused ATPase/permease subunit
MNNFSILGLLIKEYRLKLFLTYSLFSLEMLGALLRPFFLGLAINDLIKGGYQGLIILSIIHLCWLIIGTIRHMYDTRTFTSIYTSMVTRFLSKRNQSADVSMLSAHSTLSRELVDFLESDLPYIIEAFYNIVGSLVLLYFYESSVVLICFAILLPVGIISYFYGKKMSNLTKMKNDELEKQVSVIAFGNKDSISKHYNKLRILQIKISDKEAWNFGMIEILVLIVIGLSLVVSSKLFGTILLAGNIIGIYNYILKFVSGLDTIPYTVQRFSLLKDIIKRIENQSDKINLPNNGEAQTQEKFTQGVLKLSA